MAEEDKPEAQMSKCAFEYFADIIKVLQIVSYQIGMA